MDSPLLSLLTREGVLVKVSVRYWRGCKKLKAEDLGLKSADISDRLISLGHKRLLPRESTQHLALLEGRAHALIEGNTFPFLNGPGHFLPNARLAEITQRLTELEAVEEGGAWRNNSTVSWTAPSSNGGSPITGYIVTPVIGAIEQPPTTFNATTTTQTVTGLQSSRRW